MTGFVTTNKVLCGDLGNYEESYKGNYSLAFKEDYSSQYVGYGKSNNWEKIGMSEDDARKFINERIEELKSMGVVPGQVIRKTYPDSKMTNVTYFFLTGFERDPRKAWKSIPIRFVDILVGCYITSYPNGERECGKYITTMSHCDVLGPDEECNKILAEVMANGSAPSINVGE